MICSISEIYYLHIKIQGWPSNIDIILSGVSYITYISAVEKKTVKTSHTEYLLWSLLLHRKLHTGYRNLSFITGTTKQFLYMLGLNPNFTFHEHSIFQIINRLIYKLCHFIAMKNEKRNEILKILFKKLQSQK